MSALANKSSDPKSILADLKDACGTASFATCHNALQALLAVRQEPSETTPVFISRACEALCHSQRGDKGLMGAENCLYMAVKVSI